jgi:hypothetical protein
LRRGEHGHFRQKEVNAKVASGAKGRKQIARSGQSVRLRSLRLLRLLRFIIFLTGGAVVLWRPY